MVESDRDYDGRTPPLIIDGRGHLGRIRPYANEFEGWQLKLNLADKSEELWGAAYPPVAPGLTPDGSPSPPAVARTR
jgi:hypothetical protein